MISFDEVVADEVDELDDVDELDAFFALVNALDLFVDKLV